MARATLREEGAVAMMTASSADKYEARLRWYLWDGGFLAVGRSEGVVPLHAHHAIQIVISLEGPALIRSEGEPEMRPAQGLLVRPDVVHSFSGNGMIGAMLFVDPESHEGRWLLSSMTAEITLLPAARVQDCVHELAKFLATPLEALEIGPLVLHCVRALCAGPPPSRSMDPRITQTLALLRRPEGARMSLEQAAAAAFLSPSRYAHLFTQHVGLPFRRYLLWRKVMRAMLAIGRGNTLAAAAHSAGFSDSAHLTRTFYQMFGLAPSVVMKGEYYEIESPFM